MKGVLVLAHGSRRKETEQTLETVVQGARELLPGTKVRIAYMEFSERTIAAGLQALVEEGATEIAAVPYFLFEGVHIHEDIPQELTAFSAQHPGITVTLGKTLGADPRLSAILADRVRECL